MKIRNSLRGASGCLVLFIIAVVLLIIIGIFTPAHEPNVEEIAEMVLKDSLKDRSFYERIQIRTYDTPGGGKSVLIDFKAKNSFGALVPDGRTFLFDANKNLVDSNGNILEKFK